MQSACSQNAMNLIIVGLVFGTLWLGGLLGAVLTFRKLAADLYGDVTQKKSLAQMLSSGDRQLAVGYVLSMVASNIGFLGLVIGMPILGAQRRKLTC